MAESELKQLIKQLAHTCGSAILAIILPQESLLPRHLMQLHKGTGQSQYKNLSIVLHSSGGDINTAYQIIELLRNHCTNMTTIVPLCAKSAATLFILGSDRIVMGEIAQLGPLDTQIGEREEGARKYTSALNPFKTLEELQRFSLETLDVTVKLLLTRAELSVDEAIKHGMYFAAKISGPLFSQLKVEKVGECSRALAVGKEYGERLLKRYTKWKNSEKRDSILEKLIKYYPSHDYIIDHKELKDIGFDPDLPSQDEKPILQKIIKYLIQTSQTEILLVNEATHSNNIKKTKSTKKEGRNA